MSSVANPAPPPPHEMGTFRLRRQDPDRPSDPSCDPNQRAGRAVASTSTGLKLVKSAGARGGVTGARARVCPGVAALGRNERSTRPGTARRPLAIVSTRVARRGWGEWVEL